MPQLKKTGRAAAITGALAASYVFILGPILRKNPNLAIPAGIGIAVGVPLTGMYLSRKYPVMGPALAGAGLGTLFTAMAVVFTGDYTLAGSSPQLSRRIEEGTRVADLEDFSEALGLALTGGA